MIETNSADRHGGVIHNWQMIEQTSPSGKIMYQCPNCKLFDCAPVKAIYESRPCEPDLYKGHWRIENGKVYANW